MIASSMIELFFFLVLWHVIADYPLQGDFLSKAKNRNMPIPYVPWYQAMGAHSLIHAGGVYLITGLWWLGVMEFLIHFYVDDSKCMGRLSFNQDQFFHILCKFVWVMFVVVTL